MSDPGDAISHTHAARASAHVQFQRWTSPHPSVLEALPGVDEARRVVELSVRLVPPEVLPGVLQRRQSDDDADGDQGYLRLERVHYRDKVQDGQADEVKVGQPVKLLEEVHGEEEEGGVFGGLDGVSREVPVGLLPLFLSLIRQVGLQAAELLFPRPLTTQGVPQQVQRVLPRHGGSVRFSLSQLLDPSILSQQLLRLSE